MKEPSLKGLATGIGSLPLVDAEKAVDLVLKYLPEIPFWPQLPKKDPREGMTTQFSQNLPLLKLTSEGLVFNPENKEKQLELFYERIISSDTDYFGLSPEYASGFWEFYKRLKKIDLSGIKFIKCHITGPFTFAASLTDENGSSWMNDPVLFEVVQKGLLLKAKWQIDKLKEFKKPLILFLDEPYLGCFGSAYTPLNREQVVCALEDFSISLKEDGLKIGIHCCGNTDWSIFTETKGIDIINFDAFGFAEKVFLYAPQLKEFFKRGGLLCWGIIPTQDFDSETDVEFLFSHLQKGIEILTKKGLDIAVIKEQMLLSPSCGLGTLSAEKAEGILTTLKQLSYKVNAL